MNTILTNFKIQNNSKIKKHNENHILSQNIMII